MLLYVCFVRVHMCAACVRVCVCMCVCVCVWSLLEVALQLLHATSGPLEAVEGSLDQRSHDAAHVDLVPAAVALPVVFHAQPRGERHRGVTGGRAGPPPVPCSGSRGRGVTGGRAGPPPTRSGSRRLQHANNNTFGKCVGVFSFRIVLQPFQPWP